MTNQGATSGRANKGKPDARISRALEYITCHLDDELSLSVLSRECGLSRYHFHRLFASSTGMTAAQFVQLSRLKRASLQLVFNRPRRITDIALDAGFEFPESFARAFKRVHGQPPSQFRRLPDWKHWWQIHHDDKRIRKEQATMQVNIIDFPETLVAAVEHHGPESQTYSATMKLIEWRQDNGVGPDRGDTYGIHYTDPGNTFPEDFRLDVCVSVAREIPDNPQGVINKVIPACRCAVARHLGSRDNVSAAEYLVFDWLPSSGEALGDFPIFFHYVNVGPNVAEKDMITDVYLPLK